MFVALENEKVIKLTPRPVFYVPALPHESWVASNELYISLHVIGAEKYT